MILVSKDEFMSNFFKNKVEMQKIRPGSPRASELARAQAPSTAAEAETVDVNLSRMKEKRSSSSRHWTKSAEQALPLPEPGLAREQTWRDK